MSNNRVVNILIFMGIYPNVGGVERVSTMLANQFVEQGCNVSIVSFEQPMPELAAKELNPAVKLHALSFPLKQKSNLATLRQIILDEQTDIIINQWALPWYVNQLINRARRGTNCRLISVLHNKPDSNTRIEAVKMAINARQGFRPLLKLKLWAVNTVTRLSLRYVYRHSDRFIVLSDSFVPLFLRYIHSSDSSRIIALGNPLCIPEAEAITPIEQRSDIVYVGRIEENQKHVSRLVDIWARVVAKHPKRQLTIVGDGPDFPALRAAFAARNLPNVRFTGFTDPAPYLDNAAVLVMVSEYEGFGLVIIEAMSRGTAPVVLNSFSACSDVIPDDTVGIKVEPPFDADTFADVVSGLISDPERLSAMSSNAVAFSRSFTPAAVTAQWIQLFDELTILHN